MKAVLLAFSFCLFTEWALAQSDYIVLIKGDTLRGIVTDRSEGFRTKLYTKVRLKQAGKGTKKYAPRQLKAYSTGTQRYEVHWIKTETRMLKVNYPSIKGKGEAVFLRVIASGKLSLYHWEYVDPDSGLIDYVDLLKRTNDPYFIRATQGVFGLRKQAISAYLTDSPATIHALESGEIKTAFELVKVYNDGQ